MISMTSSLETGVAKIDEQHKTLFDRINDVFYMGGKGLSKEEADKTLKFLGDYIRKHFADEEKMQIEYKYPKHEQHKKMHESYIAAFNALKLEYEKNGHSSAFSAQLNKSIIDWILKHISTEDKDLGRFINGK